MAKKLRYLFTILAAIGLIVGLGGKSTTSGSWGYLLFIISLIAGYIALRSERKSKNQTAGGDSKANDA